MSTANADEFGGPDDLDDRARDAVTSLLFRLADDELVAAERYTEWQVRAPTLESDISLSNIAQDELGHARLWYQVLTTFGYDETDLIWERDPDDFRHSTIVELPFESGEWADPILRGYLYDVAEDLRLDSLEGSAYRPIRDRVGKVRAEEEYHLEYAENWMKRLAADDDGRKRLQSALDRLYPYALTLFTPPADDVALELGIRDRSMPDLAQEWDERTTEFLTGLGLSIPEYDLPDSRDQETEKSAVPVPSGRDGGHTDHWTPLHSEMTATYEELGRENATRIIDNE